MGVVTRADFEVQRVGAARPDGSGPVHRQLGAVHDQPAAAKAASKYIRQSQWNGA